MYAGRGDVAAATAAFREVLRLRPGANAAQVELAKLQTLSGNAKDAVQTAADAAKSQPDSLQARLTLVRGLIVAGDFTRAERELSSLRADHPDLVDVYVHTASLALLKNDIARARTELDHAQKIAPQSVDVLAGLIAFDLKTKNPSSAKARIAERLKWDGSPGVLLLAARTYVAAGDVAAAERSLRKAIDTDPSLLPPYEMLGRLYVSEKKLNEARAEIDTLATKQVNPVPALTLSGLILHTQGNLELAKQKYREALAKDSRAVVAANNLAWMYAESGESLDEALQLAQTATAAMPETPELMDTLGWVYYKKNLPELAIPLFNKCVEKAPRNASYHYHLGLSYVKAGDSVRGRRALEKALGLGADEATKSHITRVLSGL
jgi:tetratricopeptide (TPR) repeat protein